MNRTNVIHLLEKKINREYIIEDEMMNKHTTFKVGGPADLYVIPRSEEELVYAIEVCKSENVPYYVIGNGSNLLVTDKGFRGVIIEVYRQMSDITVEGNCITAYAGALLSKIANTALEHGLTGLEFAHGIPGALGGAVTMNAGAYDGEMKQVLERIWCATDRTKGPVCIRNQPRRTAMASISILTSFGRRATSTQERAGNGALCSVKKASYSALTAAKSFRSSTNTVVFTISATRRLAASTIARTFSRD